MSGGEPIARRKLAHEVFDRLEAMILGGALAVGDALPSERELMERFGVGRPAIREAMHALSHLGLIQISHGERARVVALTPDSLLRQIDLPARLMLSTSEGSLGHLLETRLLFECGVVRTAAERATAADVRTLQTLVRTQQAALPRMADFVRIDMEFHAAIAEMVGNPILVAVSRAMLGWLRQYRAEMLHWSGKENVTIAEHREIVAAIAAADAVGAEEAMTRHLKRSRALYLRDQEEAPAAPPRRKRRTDG